MNVLCNFMFQGEITRICILIVFICGDHYSSKFLVHQQRLLLKEDD